MKKEIVKKKLVFRKKLVANLDGKSANQILGGAGNTYSDTPCACSQLPFFCIPPPPPPPDTDTLSSAYPVRICDCLIE